VKAGVINQVLDLSGFIVLGKYHATVNLFLCASPSPSFQHHGIGGRGSEDGTHPRGKGEESDGSASLPPSVRATSAGAAEEQGRRQYPTAATKDETGPRCLQHGESAGRVGDPGLKDGSPPAQECCLSASEDEQLPLHRGQDGAAAAYPRSRSQGSVATSAQGCPLATTSSRSSGLFDSAEDNLCERAARLDVQSRA
jgi:hypothetical protein